MKKFTFIMMGLLLFLAGANSEPQNLALTVAYNASVDGNVVTFKDNQGIGFSSLGGNDWADTYNAGETHTFTVTLAETKNNTVQTLKLAATSSAVGQYGSPSFVGEPAEITVNSEEDGTKTLELSVKGNYAAVYLWATAGSENWPKVKIASITRTVTSGGGGGGSALDGKTNVAYAIPQVVNTAKYTYTFEGSDNNVSTTGFSSTNNSSTDENYQSSKNLWLRNDVKPDYSKVNAWDSQVYIDLNSSEWPAGTKAILHFAMKSSTGFNANGGTMEIAFQQNSENNTTRCGIFSAGMVPTDKWEEYDLETTVTGDAKCEKLYFNCGKFSGEFRFDDIILYKVVEEAATGGDNHFTTDDQVANIASSAFSSLAEGDYICADVTGTPEPIKLVCNGNDYPLTQFNGSTLWVIKATAEMVTALQTNDSQFKGHDLTLNEISIYKTKTISETADDNGIALVNNTFVEQNRPFAEGKWNTVCLPYKPTAAQATLLFGTGYQISGFTGVSGTTLEFTKLTSIDDFVAGRPYLLMPGTGYATSTVVLENVNITAATPETVTHTIDKKDYSFSGTFNTKSFAGTEWSTTRFVSNNFLMTPNSTDAMKGLRCYFTLPAADGARSFSLGFDEEGNTTGVADINRETIANNGDFFNLAGQRVAQPTKGLYIVNGKKVVIK